MKILVLVIFNLISWALIIGLLVLANKGKQSEKKTHTIYIIGSFMCLFLHFSSIIYHLIADKRFVIDETMYLPMYPCNVFMWIHFVLALLILINKKHTRVFQVLSEFVFFAGTIGGFLGLGFNTNYLANPDLSEYWILKGLLSHVALIFSSLYLLTGGIIKVNLKSNIVSCLYGGYLLVLCGLYTNFMLEHFVKLSYEVNSMYLLHPPLPEYPFLNIFTFAIIGLILNVIFITIYETVKLPKDERWYSSKKKKITQENA